MFEYSSHRTPEAAARYLDNLFACGIVDASDNATIIRRGNRWAILLSQGA